MKTTHNAFRLSRTARLPRTARLLAAAALCLALLPVSRSGAEVPSTAEVPVKVVATSVEASKGQVYFAVYNNEKDYKKSVYFKAAAVPSSPGSVECEFVLPEGEYVISIYQDLNANGKLDTNLVGIPKEPVGISGYSGSGIPGGFDKLKMKIDAGVKSVSVNLAKI